MGTVPSASGRHETEALVRRYLDGEPEVFSRSSEEGAVFFAGTVGAARAPLFFAIVSEGGFLVRLGAADQERHVEREHVGRNAALPAWVRPISDELGRSMERDGRRVRGEPRDWVWIPIEDEQAFNKRKPILLEALAYARHLLGERAR